MLGNVNPSKISYPLTDQKTATMAAIQSLSEVAVKPIRPYRGVAVWCVVFFALVPGMCAQEATPPRHIGVPQDWSQHHIVFSRDALARHPDLIYREPRILHQAMQRWQVPNFGVFQGTDPLPGFGKKTGLGRDWNYGLAGHIQADTFPAKYSFDPSAAPDCINDYVVFGLNITETPNGSGGNANLVGFNSLYSTQPTAGGLCDTDGPTPLFAYNITTVHGGSILTSPVLSENGKQIAFVESIPANAGQGIAAQAIFHVLTWTAGQGTPTHSAAPTMTSVPLIPSSLTTADDTTSSPWIDYGADTAYVGTDDGLLYKITGVFTPTPTLSGAPWPITLTGTRLSSPVLDANLGLLMVGGYVNGTLYQIDINSPSTPPVKLQVGYTGNGSVNPGIVAPPIVDVANGTTFVVSGYGTFVATPPAAFSAILVEADTTNLSAVPPLAVATLGEGSAGATAPNPVLHLYEPAFSNDYYNNPTTGVISLCGTGAADDTPWQYVFGFASGDVMNGATPVMSHSLNASATARCTGWTEFFNPNVPTGGSDFFFFGLTQDCNGTTGGAADGCVVALNTNGSATGYSQSATTATIVNGPSGIIVDNYSTAAQASSIYFTSAARDTAYKYTQNGLH